MLFSFRWRALSAIVSTETAAAIKAMPVTLATVDPRRNYLQGLQANTMKTKIVRMKEFLTSTLKTEASTIGASTTTSAQPTTSARRIPPTAKQTSSSSSSPQSLASRPSTTQKSSSLKKSKYSTSSASQPSAASRPSSATPTGLPLRLSSGTTARRSFRSSLPRKLRLKGSGFGLRRSLSCRESVVILLCRLLLRPRGI